MSKKYTIIIALTLTLLIVISITARFYVDNHTYNRMTTDSKYLKIGDVKFNVKIADTPTEREIGLSSFVELPRGYGLFFVFDKPGRYSFWMKNMKFPIDIMWIDSDFYIVHIEENILPESFPKSFISDTDTMYAFEVNAGVVKEKLIKVGDKVSISDL